MDEESDMDTDMSNGFMPNRVTRLFTNETSFEEDESTYTVSFRIEKDQIECCICYQAMTGAVYHCRAVNHKVHNVCGECEWRLRRQKTNNGHVKTPKCPLCKIEGEFIRNYDLERQIGDFSNPCPEHTSGCTKRFFIWAKDSCQSHVDECLFNKIYCPVCEESLDGCNTFVDHLRSGKCKYQYTQVSQIKDTTKKQRHHTEILTGQHSYIHNVSANYVIIFICQENLYYDIGVVSLEGNSTSTNQQCHLTIAKSQEQNEYALKLKEHCNGWPPLILPTRSQISANISQLSTQKKSTIQWVNHFVGRTPNPIGLMVKYFTLEEILTVGCTLDCRDFYGKWYEAEILDMVHESSHSGVNGNIRPDHTRMLVHYLGYSSNYDEWFDATSDMSRIAMSGTHTVGPNLRTIRRTNHNQLLNASQSCPPTPMTGHFISPASSDRFSASQPQNNFQR